MGRFTQLLKRIWLLDEPSVQPVELKQIRSQLNDISAEMSLLRQSCKQKQLLQHIPLPRIPDVDKYDGRAATYFQFETNLMTKVTVDGDAIGSEHDWVIYGFNRLSPDAAEKMSPWIRTRIDANERLDWKEFLKELCWTFNRDRILQKAAFERLHTIQQGHRSVREYIWEFNETLRDAGDEGKKLSEKMKMLLLERGLNEDIRMLFGGAGFAEADTLEDYCGTVYLTALNNAKALRRKSKWSEKSDRAGKEVSTSGFTIENPQISHKHIRIYSVVFDTAETSEVGGEGIKPLVYAEDISSNGSWWNGQRMGYRRGSVLLSTGDVLTLADGLTLVYESKEEEEDAKLGALVRKETSTFENDFIISHRCIGVGGYGSVHVAFDRKQKRQVACKIVNLKGIRERIKVLRKASDGPSQTDTTREAIVRRESAYLKSKMQVYDREALILQGLDHPNIISVERIYRTPDTIYIFEELITAGDLFSFLEYKNGKLDDVETAVIVYQILKGLEYLHSNNIVHRDLKPDNVLMTSLHSGYRVVLTDFGCAKRVPSAQRMMSIMGTAEYIAPEISRRKSKLTCQDHGYTATVDIWSLGCLTTVLLTGGSPFLDPNTMQYNPELAATGNIAALEDDPDWLTVGLRAKDFVRRCLELNEESRMNANEALSHSWFANKAHKGEFERVYRRAVAGWRPRHRAGKAIMYIIDACGNMRPVQPWDGKSVFRSGCSELGPSGLNEEDGWGLARSPNAKMVHFVDDMPVNQRSDKSVTALALPTDNAKKGKEDDDGIDLQMTDVEDGIANWHQSGVYGANAPTPPLTQIPTAPRMADFCGVRATQNPIKRTLFGFDSAAWN
ncbi:hypothetical protein KEM54_001383 [Ascosphaera aggregata]|nr:hypothetical protein KEM54_001383 [Ascosphaera aggregata]